MAILILVALLCCSGVVSGSETAVFSLKPGERRRLAAGHPLVRRLLDRPSALLVTLLLANIFINVAYFSVSASLSLGLIEVGSRWMAGLVGVASVVGLVIFGEIVPKTMALVAPATVVLRVTPLLLGLRMVLAPLAVVANAATRLLDTLFLGRQEPELPGASDFKTAITSQSALGTYHAVELALLHDVIDFGQRRARNLMVPRVDVVCLDVNQDTAAWVETMGRHPYRVYPVVDGSPDAIVGCVAATRVLHHGDGEQDVDTGREALIEAPLYAPVTIGAEQLVQRMADQGAPLAILLDEYGGMAGVVGMSSLTQSVLGEIAPLAGLGNAPLERRDNGTLVVRGDCPLHVLEDEAGIPLPTRRADTVAGALAEAVGRVPVVGDEVRLPGWRLRVASMQGRRLVRVVVRPSHEDEALGPHGELP